MKELLEQLREVESKYSDLVQQIMKSNGTTIAEYRLMVLVAQEINTQDKIGQETKLDTSTLSRQLKNAITKEMLEKIQTGNDKRQLIYKLTEKGLQASKNIDVELEKLGQSIIGDWSSDEIKKLEEIIKNLNSSL